MKALTSKSLFISCRDVAIRFGVVRFTETNASQKTGTSHKKVLQMKTSTCRDGTLKKPTKPCRNDTLHHSYILCHFANYAHNRTLYMLFTPTKQRYSALLTP